MSEDETVTQADLEARMSEMAAAGGGTLHMHGARVLLARPPLTVPSGVDLKGCCFELDGPGEDLSASYHLPDIATGPGGSAAVQVDEQGRVHVEVHGEGSVSGVMAEVPAE